MDILELQNKISEYLDKKGLDNKDIYFLLDDLAERYKEDILAEQESDEDELDEDELDGNEEDYDEENIVEDSIKSMNEKNNIIKRPKIPIKHKNQKQDRPTINI